MLFPRTIYADRNTLEQQIDHIESEIREAREALESGDFDRVARELVDVQHSADTGLRIAMEQHGADSYGAYTAVTINNTRRGYYGDVVGSEPK